ncbi:MAG: YdeI/OmpD-associated family protein [Mucilaginibacter sp.]|uniref:YdeI/OmpD-associated family protein n=1 Tax=Mucilaginibacter sp. TaxID=1882438 RepID=UPI0032667AB8
MMNALAKKLLIKPGKSWLFYNPPQDYLTQLHPLPEGVTTHFEPGGTFDGIQLFVHDSDELNESLSVIGPLIKPDTVAWICYPKKSSGITSDLTMMGSWDELTKYNLEVVAAASVNEVWTAVRIRTIGLAKKSNTGNAEIKQNDYSAYIDVDNRKVYLPTDVEAALKAVPQAFNLYDKLAYSHKKEYILWILSAKQEKTRTDRLAKMVEKLLSGKKNPGDK